MKKKTLSNKEKRILNEEIERYNHIFDKKDIVEVVEDDKVKVIREGDESLFFYHDDKLFPTLKLILRKDTGLKKVMVDMGAVKFVANGADIMRPGITGIDEEIDKGDIVVIIDEKNKKPLAIGKAKLSSEDMREKESGKVISSIHFIGDDIWNF